MVNQAKARSKTDGHAYLRGVFYDIEDEMRRSLSSERRRATHDGTLGGNSEELWRILLRRYLPARYQVEEAFVIDSQGDTSDQIDIVIFDAIYTSPLYGHDQKKYLPRESVYAAFEVKPKVNKEHLEYAGAKAASVVQLKCTSSPMINAGRPVPPRETFRPLTGLIADTVDWTDGIESNSFRENLPATDHERLDFVVTASSGIYDGRLNSEAEIIVGDGSLMRGIFKLLQALQTLGTVPSIDWRIYEKVLDQAASS